MRLHIRYVRVVPKQDSEIERGRCLQIRTQLKERNTSSLKFDVIVVSRTKDYRPCFLRWYHVVFSDLRIEINLY